MKLNSKFNLALIAFIYLFISYSLCSSHELPQSGYISRRKRFCSTPLEFIVLIFLFVIIFYDHISKFLSKFKL